MHAVQLEQKLSNADALRQRLESDLAAAHRQLHTTLVQMTSLTDKHNVNVNLFLFIFKAESRAQLEQARQAHEAQARSWSATQREDEAAQVITPLAMSVRVGPCGTVCAWWERGFSLPYSLGQILSSSFLLLLFKFLLLPYSFGQILFSLSFFPSSSSSCLFFLMLAGSRQGRRVRWLN